MIENPRQKERARVSGIQMLNSLGFIREARSRFV